MRLLILLLSLLLFACSESQTTITRVAQPSDIADLKKELYDSLSIFKSQYKKLYEKQLSIGSNDSIKANLQAFNAVFLNTSELIDSVRSYVDTMDYRTETNILLMQRKFVDEGLGDTLFQKMSQVLELAKKVAPQSAYSIIQAQHAAIFNNQDAESWKKQYFGLNNPLGVNILLYGFQSALYQASHHSLSK